MKTRIAASIIEIHILLAAMVTYLSIDKENCSLELLKYLEYSVYISATFNFILLFVFWGV